MARRGNRFTSFLIIFILSGVYLFVFSESGLLERINLQKKKDRLLQQIEELEKEKKGHEALLNRYGTGIEPMEDVLNSGIMPGGDRLVFLKDPGEELKSGAEKTGGDRPFHFELTHYRVLWFVLSVLIFFLYYIYIVRRRNVKGVKGDV